MSRRRERGKVDLEAMVCGGGASAYEALELYKSKANRFKLKNDIDQSIDTLAKGAVIMIKHSYYTCAEELCNQLISLLSESSVSLTLEVRSAINSIDAVFSERGHEVRYSFLRACVQWSSSVGDRKYGDLLLQTQLGDCIWRKGDFRKSLHHFAAGESPDTLWGLIESSLAADFIIKEQIVALGVLHFLALENLRDANELWKKHIASLDTKAKEAGIHCFIGYLLQTCERDAAPLFKTLCDRYKADLQFDEAVESLLHGPIALKFFRIQPAARAGGLFSMFQDLLGGGGIEGMF